MADKENDGEATRLAADLCRRFEGLRLSPYHDSVGYPTIGYGRLLSRQRGGSLAQWPSISQDEADALLLTDLAMSARGVLRLCPAPLTDGQRGALIDFAFNLGAGALQSSALRQCVLRGDHDGAAEQFGRWVYAGGIKLAGLVRRRKAEAELYASR